MITKDQALTARVFHWNGPMYRGNQPLGKAFECAVSVGPRGGTKIHVHLLRRNGRTQTWKTRPDEFRIPIKEGFRGYGEILHTDAQYVHIPADCPVEELRNTY